MSGTVAAAREDTCEICTEHDVVEATNIAASALKATLDRTPQPGALVHPAPGADISTGDATGGSGSPSARPRWLRVAPWVAFAAAAGAIGAGAYYLSWNDKGQGSDLLNKEPTRFYDTGWQGGAWIGAGVVAAALGVLALTWTPSNGSAPAPGSTTSAGSASAAAAIRPTGVSLSPAGIAAWTRF